MPDRLHIMMHWLAGKTISLSVVVATMFGFLGEKTGLIFNDNRQWLFIGFCGAAGAFFGSIHKIMGTWLTHRANTRDFIGKETRDMMMYLRKKADDNERILDISTEVRHEIQGAYQVALSHINFLEMSLTGCGNTTIPKYKELDVAGALKTMGEEIRNIKNGCAP